jgi:hypothetical protein
MLEVLRHKIPDIDISIKMHQLNRAIADELWDEVDLQCEVFTLGGGLVIGDHIHCSVAIGE